MCDLAAVPGAPSSLRLTGVQRDAVTLSWEPPDVDGGAPITGYLVERCDATRGGAGWATVGHLDASTFSFRATKLLEANRYHFRVTAENAVGTGQPIETTHAVEVKSPFGQSTILLRNMLRIRPINNNRLNILTKTVLKTYS